MNKYWLGGLEISCLVIDGDKLVELAVNGGKEAEGVVESYFNQTIEAKKIMKTVNMAEIKRVHYNEHKKRILLSMSEDDQTREVFGFKSFEARDEVFALVKEATYKDIEIERKKLNRFSACWSSVFFI